jgi:hypothetical protein
LRPVADEPARCQASSQHQDGNSGRERQEAMAAEPNSVTFQTTAAVTGNNTGIVVPAEAIEQLAAGKRPPVLVNATGTNTGTRSA